MKETIKKERSWETLKRVGLCVHGSALQEESRHDLELSRNSWHLVLRSQMNPKQIHIASKIEDRDTPRKQPKGKEGLKTIFLLKKWIQQQIFSTTTMEKCGVSSFGCSILSFQNECGWGKTVSLAECWKNYLQAKEWSWTLKNESI